MIHARALASSIAVGLASLLGACAGGTPTCETPERAADLPAEVRESSGIAASRTHTGVLWTHNDSGGDAVLFALDTSGALLGSVAVTGADFTDWEDIEAGSCDGGECLYIGDIGNNRGARGEGVIYRISEPAPDAPASAPAERFPIRYPEGNWDAEALFVLPGPELYVISKGVDQPVTLFRYPPPLRPDEPVRLEPVQRLTEAPVSLPDQVTGASADPDGRWVAVRTYTALQLYRHDGGAFEATLDSAGVDLSTLVEPQGEGVGIAADGVIYLSSERGLHDAAPIGRLRCSLPR